MSAGAPIMVTPEVRAAIEVVRLELGPHRIVIEPGWSGVAADLGLVDSGVAAAGPAGSRMATLHVGEIEAIDDGASKLGFIAPGATDPTMRLWEQGWSPVTVHRIPTRGPRRSRVEVVIATARPIPPATKIYRAPADSSG